MAVHICLNSGLMYMLLVPKSPELAQNIFESFVAENIVIW